MAKLAEADYYDAAFFAGLPGGRGVTAADILDGKAPRRIVTAKDVLSKAEPSSEEKLRVLERERDTINQKRQFGYGTDDVAKWRLVNPVEPGEEAKTDEQVSDQLRAEAQVRGTELARELIAAQVQVEIDQAIAVEAKACAGRYASLSADQVKAMKDEIKQAEAEVARIADRSERFEDMHAGDTAAAVQGRRDDIARDHGVASERHFQAQRSMRR